MGKSERSCSCAGEVGSARGGRKCTGERAGPWRQSSFLRAFGPVVPSQIKRDGASRNNLGRETTGQEFVMRRNLFSNKFEFTSDQLMDELVLAGDWFG